MSVTEDYKRARLALRHLNAAGQKITLTARQRMAAHSIQEQLQMHCKALEDEFGHQIPDQADVDFALRHEASNAKGWDRG
jgi:hypothetical protein